ncbi:MAG: fumarylacetoacetate hydrolase family protein, partial [Chloroflexota bacterium]|nr:fumarylacetoacetate hydrolase family protein [Chloroflexota bacterium]
MKLVMYNDNQPGILTDAGVIGVGDLCPGSGQEAMVHLITNYDDLKSQLEHRAATGTTVAGARLRAPLPSPNKILCMGGNFREFGAREPSPMWGFIKRLHSILSPGGAVVLPDVDANIFHHEAELVLVFGRGGKDIPASEAMD